jgi:polyisoprenoid-binding protein YceI
VQQQHIPLATFVPMEVTGLPTTYTDGEQINFQITGDLTVREVTQPATFDVTLQLNGDTITGEARSTILMSDYGVGPISIGGILNTEDEVGVTFTIVARP